MGKLFGTDGVRGIANADLSVELTYKLGRIGGYFLTKGKARPKMVVGADTRISKDMLMGALIAGMNSAGIDVLNVGVVPTPAVAYLIKALNADGGVMISASHNPVEYNGIKFFDENSFKLTDEIENSIEEYILNNLDIDVLAIKEKVGRSIVVENPSKLYAEFLKSTVNTNFAGMRVAVDCANGAAFEVAPKLLKELGAEVIVIHSEPNGININVECGSTKPEEIKRLTIETGADIGLSFDGDADRLIACDEKGNIVDGDHILAVCGTFMKKSGKLNKDTIVGTVMSNMGLDIALKEEGIKIVKANVGDRYVLEEMRNNGYSLGGEQSGHIIFLDYITTGDGLLTGIQLLNVVKETGKNLSELSSMMKDMPQTLINAIVDKDKKYDYKADLEVAEKIREIENHFAGKGRVLIRPSGTEPLVRVMIEGDNQVEIENYAKDLAVLIENKFK